MRSFLFFLALVGAACGAGKSTVSAPTDPVPGPRSDPAEGPDAAPAPLAPAGHDAGPPADGPPLLPKLCGCSLCAPVVSEDACTLDADCAPQTPCHATACVAKAKAQPSAPGTHCTMDLRCDSVDANRCGCVSGRCTLAPRTQGP